MCYKWLNQNAMEMHGSALPKITLEQFASCTVSQSSDGLLLDLPYTLSGKSEILTYLLQSHLLCPYAKEILHNIPLPLCKS